jgi:hypothetical protein
MLSFTCPKSLGHLAFWLGHLARSPAVRSGSSFLSIGEAGHERRRRQCRAVPGGDRRQVGQVEGETAHRLPIGRAVAWSGCRGAGRRGRGCRRRGPCWQCSITGSSSGPSSSRSVKPATKRRRRQCRAVPGGDRRQAGQGEGETAHRLPIGVAVVVVALVQGSVGYAWWPQGGVARAGSARSPAVRSGPSSSRSVKPATRRRRRQRRAVPGGDRRQVGQVEGETAHRLPIGSSSSRLGKPATRR